VPAKRRLVLASASPRRRELLARAALAFEVAESPYEEDLTLDLPPAALARHLAREKARAAGPAHPDSVLLAADTIVVLGERVLGKPADGEDARRMLRRLSGRAHRVITGFTVLDTNSGRETTASLETTVRFRSLREEEIEAYVAGGEPLDKAGAYAIQEGGARFVERMEGDYDNVVGLPVADVLRVLAEFGVFPGKG
jgi:septum formation protein